MLGIWKLYHLIWLKPIKLVKNNQSMQRYQMVTEKQGNNENVLVEKIKRYFWLRQLKQARKCIFWKKNIKIQRKKIRALLGYTENCVA